MDMDIDQARSNHQAFRLDDLRLGLFAGSVQFSRGLDGNHTAVLEQDIAVRIDPGRRIDQAAAANQHRVQARPRFFATGCFTVRGAWSTSAR